ncbi:MAG: FAD:protein FMN transferase [Spirochaetes bacterium]|nr:FAD:protein FMN transferase [Spirochaetota bacterium]MBN2770334.1 FAD:protein FMN transferase [Spirochaetota bacterium]
MKKVILLFLMFSCAKLQETEQKKPYSLTKTKMGTVVTITVYTEESQKAYDAMNKAFDEISRLESLLGPGPNSDVTRINKSEPGEAVIVSKECADVINIALKVSKESSGAFDISFASAGQLYNFNDIPFFPPSNEEMQKALSGVGYQKIELDYKAKKVYRKSSKTRIGLGGVAKGFIISKCVQSLKDSGMTSALVNAGGDLQALGSKNDDPWTAGLINPRDNSKLLLYFDIINGQTCVTSGDYERFAFDKDGRRYHHIIDPRTGYPAQGLVSVTVITSDAALADAYSTAFFVMGKDKVVEFLKSRKDINVILIDQDQKIYVSEGIFDNIHILQDDLIINKLI